MDAASNNSVDDVRQIVEEVSYSPAEGKYKVYIIDEVHMLSNSAFNALLKTLEEPPSYVIFILATTEANKIPITVLSRCQRYDFKRISIETIADRMRELMEKEGVTVEDKALRYVARMADGSMRDGLSLLDRCISFNFGKTLTYDMAIDVLGSVDAVVFGKLFEACINRDVNGCLMVVHDVVMQGREISQFVSDYIWYVRSLLLLKCSDNIEDVVDVSSENLAVMKQETELTDENELMRFIRIFSDLQGQLKYSTAKRVMVEMALIRICRPQMETGNDALLSRIRDLEKKLESGQFVSSMPASVTDQGRPAHEGAAVKSSEEAAKEKIEALAKALPDDIKQVVSRWGEIKSRVVSPLLKQYLQQARLSIAGDELVIAVPDGIAGDYLTDPNNKAALDELDRIMSDRTGKKVSFTVKVMRDSAADEAVYPDIEKLIRMDVEEGGEDEDPLD